MSDDLATRVLLVAPTKKDGEVTSSLLRKAGLICIVCDDLNRLAREVRAGAGAVLLTEEVLGAPEIDNVLRSLAEQPSWSDLPIIMLIRGGVTSPAAANVLREMRNVTLVERPAPTRSVVSAVEAAVRSRERQYQIRDQIEAIRIVRNERERLLESERASRQELERVGRIKDEFLATLSHELRTPLSAIFGWVQILRLKDPDAETISEGINVIDRNVRLQTQLIDDLLDMSRIISGKLRLDVQAVNMADVIDSAIESVMPAMKAKEIRLKKIVDPSAVSVSGDPGRLQQVLWNVLTNAIKFTPKNGRIDVLAERVDSHLEIRVRDTGEGMTAEFLPYIFERFKQADPSITRKHGGLGLGLSIVRNLVELHGGVIRAESPGLGQGATFTVSLPLRVVTNDVKRPPTNSHALDARHCEPASLSGLKVLVVDDETDGRELVRRFLLECEAITSLAGSSAEAQAIIPAFQPDVIVSDIGMPIQDGYEFMRIMRAQGLRTPAVALTAFARPEDRIRSIQAGYQMHLPKPVEPAELIAVIAGLAGRYESLHRASIE
jgi:signal transduction histidine kinase/ActR/RegA family two-component response regulator